MSLSSACLAIFVVSLLKGRIFSAMSPRKSNSALDSWFTLDLWLFCARNVLRFSSTPSEPRTDDFHKIRIRMGFADDFRANAFVFLYYWWLHVC